MMKALSVTLIVFSVAVSAQQKENKAAWPKKDTAKVHVSDSVQNVKRQDLYKMPSLKPDPSKYSSLKDKRKDSTDYKMLNAMIPEKKEDDK